MNFQFFSIAGFVVCITYFLAGFIDSVCGGGGLITVPALMALGVPAHMIVGTNQASTILGSAAAFYTYIKSKKIYYLSAIAALPFAMIGSYIGSDLNMLLPEKYIQLIILIMIPILAVLLFLKKDLGNQHLVDSLSKSQIIIASCLVGLFIGTYQGFYGPGGGMIALFFFSFFLKMDMLHANGSTKFVVFFSSIIASINYALSGNVIVKIVLLATIFNIMRVRIMLMTILIAAANSAHTSSSN